MHAHKDAGIAVQQRTQTLTQCPWFFVRIPQQGDLIRGLRVDIMLLSRTHLQHHVHSTRCAAAAPLPRAPPRLQSQQRLHPPALSVHTLRPQQSRLRCRSISSGSSGSSPIAADAIPQDVKLEVASDEQQQEVTYDEASKTVRIPLKATDGGRRTKLVMFTCNQCGGRSARLVNPIAWEKGLVFCQCQHCGVWHTIAANNPKIYEEIRYKDSPSTSSRSSSSADSSSTDGSEGSADSSGTELELPAPGGLQEQEVTSAPPQQQ